MAESVAAPWALVSSLGGGVHLDAAPASVFLKTSPHGAYTTTRTGSEGERLLLWRRHLRRLAQSMEVLAEAMPERFPRPPGSFSRLQELVQPSLQAGLQKALSLRRPGEELNLTVLASPTTTRTWDVRTHLSSYIPRPIHAHVAILGSGRALPQAKYSQWATARAPLEELKPHWATEVLLSHDGDHLLEGSVTNFFVATDSEIQTAALEDGVLPGVIRQLVIEVCHEDGISVREVAPSWRERGEWMEGFLTSSLRMVQPVASIRRSDEAEEVRFGESYGVAERIRGRILERALEEGIPVLEFVH